MTSRSELERGTQDSRGFTLVELLASMTILVVLVLLMTRIFAQSTQLYEIGMRQTQNVAAGRAMLMSLASEISATVADDRLSMRKRVDDFQTYSTKYRADLLDIVSLSHSVETDRQSRHGEQISYRVDTDTDFPDRFQLERENSSNPRSASYTCYAGDSSQAWYPGGGHNKVIENLVTFELWAFDENGNELGDFDTPSESRPMPAYMEVLVAFLSDADAERAASGSIGDIDAFIENNMAAFQARIHFPMRKAAIRNMSRRTE